MSIENVQLFYEKMQHDEALQTQLKQSLNQANDQYAENIVQLGSQNGYTFNKADVHQLVIEETTRYQKDGELDDADLEGVAGGVVWVPVAIIAGVAGAVSVTAVGGIIAGTIVKVATQE